ncbi:MAG: hypothetical protein CL573_01990 [Alphaproteobacteria bacterium]|nr:hypothetical protein [Alphaproteobacteria bacterium]
MPGSSSRRHRSAVNYWPGFVDALAALLIVVVFLVMVFALAQAFLSDALSGRDNALSKLNQQVNELARMLDLERSANAELTLSVSQISAQLQGSISERDALVDRLSIIEADLETTHRNNAAELDRLRTQISADKEKMGDQRRNLSRLEADVAAGKSRLADITERAKTAEASFSKQREISRSAQDQVALLNQQLVALRRQLASLNEALDASEAKNHEQEVQMVNLGKRLNEALATKVQELARYRSEFFGRLREVLGDRSNIRIEGDRFVFQSEVLFASSQAILNPEGEAQLQKLARTLVQIGSEIPEDIDWILRVDGHTDERPINTARFPSNWELASARAISVVKFLASSGIPPENLVAAGFGEFQPIDRGEDEIAYRRNRRIEFKLDQR